MAILAGDALLTLDFEVLTRIKQASAERKIRLVEELSRAAGTVGGTSRGFETLPLSLLGWVCPQKSKSAAGNFCTRERARCGAGWL